VHLDVNMHRKTNLIRKLFFVYSVNLCMFRVYLCPSSGGRLRLKCDGTRAETRFLLSAKRTCPFKSAGASVQSTTGSRGVRISGNNAGYTMFRGSVKGNWPPTPFANFLLTSPPVRHRVPSHFNWTLQPYVYNNWYLLFFLHDCLWS